MDILLVTAHPLHDSLTSHLARHLRDRLVNDGHAVRFTDLYAQGFDPVMPPDERADYGKAPVTDSAGLQQAEAIVLVFPTWWAGPPAILKGWFDRNFLPGVAFDQTDSGGMAPRLTRLREILVVTSLGSAWWVDWLVLWRATRRILRWNIFRPCAPKARFRMESLYNSGAMTPDRLTAFCTKLDRITASFVKDPA